MTTMRSSFAVLVVLLAGCGPSAAGGSEGGTPSEGESSSTTSDEPVETSDEGMDEEYCGGFEIVPSFVPPNVVFIVDTSSSMLESWDHDQDPMTPEVSRWHGARTLLNQLLLELDPRIWLGLQRVPAAEVCLVGATPEIELGEDQAGQILATLPDADASSLEIVGGSPLGAAWLSARDHLLAQTESSALAIVLVTDGGANCSEPNLPEAVEVFDAELEGLVEAGYMEHGILTIVVAADVAEGQPSSAAQPDSPAVDTYAALNAIALAGGIPWNGGMEPQKFFDVGQLDELEQVFEIEGGTDCTIDLTMVPGGPPDPDQIPLMVIEMDGLEVPYVVDCANEDGWSWIVEGEILSFCGEHCEKLILGSPVEVFYGCPLPN